MSDNKNNQSSDKRKPKSIDKKDKKFSDKKEKRSFTRKDNRSSDKKENKPFDKRDKKYSDKKEEKTFDKKDSKFPKKREHKSFYKKYKNYADKKSDNSFEKRNEKYAEKRERKSFDKRDKKYSEKDSDHHLDNKDTRSEKRGSYEGKPRPGFKKTKYAGNQEASEIKERLIKKGAGKKQSGKQTTKEFDPMDPVRLNKYIASSGVCSRREADELIAAGKVKINGKVVTEMGIKVAPTDSVEVKGLVLNPEKKVYILLNKPKDTVSTVSDPHTERTVLDLINHPGHERIYPVGRLDRNTTGVLLLTNDGDLTKKLTHPSYNKKKIYHVVLDKIITKGELQQILEGIELDDGPIAADTISFANESDKREVGIELHSGKNRIVRRIFEHLGYRVEKLDRVYFAGLTKKNLPRGKWRYLSEKEIGTLKMGAYE